MKVNKSFFALFLVAWLIGIVAVRDFDLRCAKEFISYATGHPLPATLEEFIVRFQENEREKVEN
jgi:hypothetical protein